MKNQLVKERTHLFAPSISIAMVLDFNTVIQEQELKRAVDEVIACNQVLQSRITMDEQGNAFYEDCGTDRSADSVTIETENPFAEIGTLQYYEGDWRTIVTEQEQIPFALNQGELIRFFYSEQTENQLHTQMILMAHHLVGDGIAMKRYYAKQDAKNKRYKK